MLARLRLKRANTSEIIDEKTALAHMKQRKLQGFGNVPEPQHQEIRDKRTARHARSMAVLALLRALLPSNRRFM